MNNLDQTAISSESESECVQQFNYYYHDYMYQEYADKNCFQFGYNNSNELLDECRELENATVHLIASLYKISEEIEILIIRYKFPHKKIIKDLLILRVICDEVEIETNFDYLNRKIMSYANKVFLRGEKKAIDLVMGLNNKKAVQPNCSWCSSCDSESEFECNKIFCFLELSDCIIDINSLFIEATNHLFKLFLNELMNLNLYNKHQKNNKDFVEIFSFYLQEKLGYTSICKQFNKLYKKKKEHSLSMLTIYERQQVLDCLDLDLIDEFDFFLKRAKRIQSVWSTIFHLMACYQRNKRFSVIIQHTRKLKKKFIKAYSEEEIDDSLHFYFCHLPLMRHNFGNVFDFTSCKRHY